MHETRRLLEAAAALSQLLRAAGVPHAFYGSVFNAVLTNAPHADVSLSSWDYRSRLLKSIRKSTVLLRGVIIYIHSGEYVKRAPEAPTSLRHPHLGAAGTHRILQFASYFSLKLYPTSRLHATYHRLIPAIDVRLLSTKS